METEKSILCLLCTFKTTSNSDLNSHMEDFHSDIYSPELKETEAEPEVNIKMENLSPREQQDVQLPTNQIGELNIKKTKMESDDNFVIFDYKKLKTASDNDEEAIEEDPLDVDDQLSNTSMVKKLSETNLKKRDKTFKSRKSPDDAESLKTKLVLLTSSNNLEINKIEDDRNESDFSCVFCDKMFTSLMAALMHMKESHSENKTATGTSTGCPSKQTNEINNAGIMKITDNRYACDHCPKKYQATITLQRHILDAHPGVNPTGSLESSTASNQHQNLDHKWLMSVGDRYTCKQCFKTFASNDEASSHVKDHVFGRALVCKKCNKMYKTRSSLSTHKKNCSVAKHGLYQCNHCTASFDKMYHFATHQKTCTAIKDIAVESQSLHPCPFCDEKFSTKSGCSDHQRQKHTSLMYICKKCDQSFNSRFELKNHLKSVHSKAVSLRCIHCHKNFSSEITLSSHLEKSHNKQQWNCQMCGETFEFVGKLSKHVLVAHKIVAHSECTFCMRVFPGIPELIEHQRLEHSDKKWKCLECGKACEKERQFFVHMEKHHAEKVE